VSVCTMQMVDMIIRCTHKLARWICIHQVGCTSNVLLQKTRWMQIISPSFVAPIHKGQLSDHRK
jgi:hypothetical protein